MIFSPQHGQASGSALPTREKLHAVENEMEKQLEQVPYAENLLSIPGLGTVTVAVVIGELGDLRAYQTAEQILKMAGLDLIENSSGKKKGKRRISRRGRSYLRQVLYMAALTLGTCSAPFAERRRSMLEKGKAKKQAAVANARALLRTIHALVRDRTYFDPKEITKTRQQAA